MCWARSFWRVAWAKKRIIAETGAAASTVCGYGGTVCAKVRSAMRRLSCVRIDVERQAPTCSAWRCWGHEVDPRDVWAWHAERTDEYDALRDWRTNVRDTFYCIGKLPARTPYRAMSAISNRSSARKCAKQMRCREGRLARITLDAGDGGGRTRGLFYPSLTTKDVEHSSASKQAARV